MLTFQEELCFMLSHAATLFFIAPLKRIEMLMTVEEDLKRERILPQRGFEGVRGCIRFMYQSGGIRSFFRGVELEVGVTCIYKFICNRYIIIPLTHVLPFRMRDNMVLTTLVHTLIGVPLLAPVQMFLETVVANLVTDFIPRDIAEKVKRVYQGGAGGDNNNNNMSEAGGSSSSPTGVVEGGGGAIMNSSLSAMSNTSETASIDQFINNNSIYRNCNNLKNESFVIPLHADGSKYQPRFQSVKEVIGAICRTIPVRSMMGKLLFLDFMDRFFSSIMYNKLLSHLLSTYLYASDGHSDQFISLVWTLCPIVVSVSTSLVTFPMRNFLFTHFVRVRLYERIEIDALRRLEEEKRYPTSEVRNESFSTAVARMKEKCSSQHQLYVEEEAVEHDPDAVCNVIENMCHHLFHEEIRDYIRYHVEMEGVLSLYNGFPVYVGSIFASVMMGATIRLGARLIRTQLGA